MANLSILPFLTDCESTDDELNVAFDVEIDGRKIKQAGYRLYDLIFNKLQNYDELYVSGSKDEVISSLELELKEIGKCKELMENKLNELKNNDSNSSKESNLIITN